jgi:poly-beta-1,6-N-acetyl-D-glucosamine synthase
VIRVAFWLSAAFIAYVYAGYPIVIALWARFSRRRRQPEARTATKEPRVSIVIAARNEARRLPARIANLRALEYPADRCEIIVVSDGSTDDTEAVLEELARSQSDTTADLVVVSMRAGGKARALNAGVAHARHEVVVFADARQSFAPDALRELTNSFADPRVGAASGELILDPGGSTIGDGVGLYWHYEKALRRCESAVASTLGATGAIYAIRRTLWRPLPPDTILDDVLTPMRIVMDGSRVVFNERARAFDSTAADAELEAQRKIRTLAGNFQLIALEPRLLLPWRNPVWFQFVSHKLARLAVPYALLIVFAASIALAAQPIYAVALAVQVAFYLLAGCGAWIEFLSRPRPVRAASTTTVPEVA